MSLNFIVQKVEDYQGLPDGVYKAQVDHVERVIGDYGNYHIVKWNIMEPSAFEGRTHQERYSVEHENNQVRHIAINNFSKFCIEVGGVKEGDEPTESDFLYKVAMITISNRIGKKDGKTYSNVIDVKLFNENSESDGAPSSNEFAPTPLPVNTWPVNDDVPF